MPQKKIPETRSADSFEKSRQEARERVAAAREKQKQKEQEKIDSRHPFAKLPSHVFMEPAIMNYLLEKNVDIPDAFKKKYGLPVNQDEEGNETFTKRRSLPIPNEIYNDPAFEEYLSAVGLAKPPQIPPGFKKLKPGERP